METDGVRRRKGAQSKKEAKNLQETLILSKQNPQDESALNPLWMHECFWAICGLIVTVKVMLFRCYTSTDFEVHRNWMAITHNEPLAKWYYNNVSQWTLDYPPFFAYFERILALIAQQFDETILLISEEPLMSTTILLFQRSSVVCTDLLYIAASAVVSETLCNRLPWAKGGLLLRLKFAVFVVLAANPSLIMVDNIHFQYNSMMYGILLLSFAAIFSEHYLLGALLFAVLLNFKHIYLYYVPAVVMFFVSEYLLPIDFSIIGRTFGLASAVILPVLASFGPFFAIGGLDGILQIVSRLFPFKRGLTHSYWAPNLWVFYNVADYSLYKLLPALKLKQICSVVPFLKCSYNDPVYTLGVVEEYSHSVLPDIDPKITFALIVLFLFPLIFVRSPSKREKLLVLVCLSAFSFFFFGWHVHEKALIMIHLPLSLLVFENIRYLDVFVLMSMVTPLTQFPLLFTPLENVAKYSLAFGGFAVVLVALRCVYHFRFSDCVSGTNMAFMSAAVALEIYKIYFHHAIFGSSKDFLPLMLTSLLCAIGVAFAYAKLVQIALCDRLTILWSKFCCHLAEGNIIIQMRKETDDVFDLSKVQFVAGVDVSALPLNLNIAVASLTVMEYPTLKVVKCVDRVVRLKSLYIPEYLAMREAPIIAELVNETKKEQRIDVLLVDGNGRYHSRFGGLACHVAYLTGIPSIGIAKKLAISPMLEYGYSEAEVKAFEHSLNNLFSSPKGPKGAMQIRMLKDVKHLLCAVGAPGHSKLLYVSIGLGIDMDAAVEIVLATLVHSVVEPIRLSDLRSRALLDALFLHAKPSIFWRK